MFEFLSYEFMQRDKNFVIERGLWMIELYSPNFSSKTNELGHKILDNGNKVKISKKTKEVINS